MSEKKNIDLFGKSQFVTKPASKFNKIENDTTCKLVISGKRSVAATKAYDRTDRSRNRRIETDAGTDRRMFEATDRRSRRIG